MEEKKELKEYNIYEGLGGGFGGASYHSTILAKSQQEAEEYAYALACETFESYEGERGLRSWAECAMDLDISLDTEDPDEMEVVDEEYNSERETWIDYYAIPTEEDDIPEDELVREHDLFQDSSEED